MVRGHEIQMSSELQTIREGNTLLVPIEIKATDQKKIDELLKQLQELDTETKAIPGFESAATRLQPEGEAAMSKFDLNMKQWMEKSGLDGADVAQFMAMMKNPAAGILRALMSNPYVAAALVAILVIPAVWDWLTDRGRPFNRFFVRKIQDEGNVGRSRQARQEIRAGFRQTIFVPSHGVPTPYTAFNSYNLVNRSKIDDILAYQIRSGRLGP